MCAQFFEFSSCTLDEQKEVKMREKFDLMKIERKALKMFQVYSGVFFHWISVNRNDGWAIYAPRNCVIFTDFEIC